jgi:WD40 repeat protein
VQAVAFNPEGTLVAAAASNGEVRLYNPTDGKRTATLTGHEGAVFSLVFSPDGKRLYTGAFDGLIREFDPATGRLTGILQPVPILKEWVGANARP